MRRRFIAILPPLFLLLVCAGVAIAQNGADVFGTRCASCHGRDGAGKTNAAQKLNGIPDLRSAEVQGKTDVQLFDSIARGTDHKKYPHVFLQTGLTQNQVAQVVTHVRELAKK